MNKYFLMQGRQTGKTTKAIYEFMKDPKNTIFVTHNLQLAKHVSKLIGGYSNNIVPADNFKRGVERKGIKNVILDEYMFFKNKDEVYRHITGLKLENVYIFSTSNKVYNKKIFKLVKENKNDMAYQDLLTKYCNMLTEDVKEEVYELYYNFITDDDTILVDTNLGGTNISNPYDLESMLGLKQYNIEINNKYLE